MAEVQLNPAFASYDNWSDIKKSTYGAILVGMKSANDVSMPNFDEAPYSQPTGEKWVDADGIEKDILAPNEEAIASKLAELSDIQAKNSAYLFADAISVAAITAAQTAVLDSSGNIDLTNYVKKSGDSVLGKLTALNSFEAGASGQKIFDTTFINATKKASVYGNLSVSGTTVLSGSLHLSDIVFNHQKTLFEEDAVFKIKHEDIELDGNALVRGCLVVDKASIDSNGVFWNGNEVYHPGNSNLPTIDWAMGNALVGKSLTVNEQTVLKGSLQSLYGFKLGTDNSILLSSAYDIETAKNYLSLNGDIDVIGNGSIKLAGQSVLRIQDGAHKTVSLSAPNKVLSLGGVGLNELPTKYISLQADVKDNSHNYTIISKSGQGFFPSGFSASHSPSGNILIKTFDDGDKGVLFPYKVALSSLNGPLLFGDETDSTFNIGFNISYIFDGVEQEDVFSGSFGMGASNSIWHNPLIADVSFHIDTIGEFIVFDKPIESKSLAINSKTHKTRLVENALFLREEAFIEGVSGGLSFNGQAYFNNNLQSQQFAGGFAGYGWSIAKDSHSGLHNATFDELVVRKKMRIYELEVQKISATNGSLWVSDSCSGDFVEEL